MCYITVKVHVISMSDNVIFVAFKKSSKTSLDSINILIKRLRNNIV